MKKSKLSLGLISCLLSVGTLAGCDTLKSSSDGVLLSYTVDGVQGKITADDILGDYYNDSTKYQAIYDTIYSVIARNYFSRDRGEVDYHGTKVKLGEPQMTTIRRDAAEKVSDDKDTAQSNADANNTKYKKEFEAILESKGVEDEEELLNKYIEELQKETFENNFYTYQVGTIKNGDANAVKSLSDGSDLFSWTGYLNDMLPYHMSHILVKLSDSSDTNYYNGTISEENAERLYNVVHELSVDKDNGGKSFSKIAMTYNEDPGSKDKEGDLGIMDRDTSFINEFKLGIYAYELFYNKTAEARASKIKVSQDIMKSYNQAVSETFDGIPVNATTFEAEEIPTVEMSVFDELKAVAKQDKDENGKPVIENATLVYPRNILYNKYLNRHSVFFITNGTADNGNFKVISGLSTKAVLCADGNTSKPIVAVRASSGGEQEIHLMVVNRSPFVLEDAKGVTLSDYYTTFYPDQDFYPTKDGKKLDTYVNFLSNDTSETKNRAEEFASKLKSYDSDKLGKYIFLKYANEEHIQFAEENKALAEALMKWIKTSIEKSAEEKEEAWTKTWNEYIDKLVRQNSERKKLVPQACRIAFLHANPENETTATVASLLSAEEKTTIKALLIEDGICADDAEATTKLNDLMRDWFKKEGGLCNDGKAHL